MSNQSDVEIRCILCPGKKRRELSVGYACGKCHGWLLSMLEEIPPLFWQLPGELFPGASAGNDGSKHAKRDFGPPPLRIDVLNLMVDSNPDANASTEPRVGALPTREALGTWLRIVWEERNFAARDLPHVGSICEALRTNLDWICEQPWLDEFAEEIRTALQVLRVACGTVEHKTLIGTCTSITDGAGDECGRRIYASPYESVITCHDCGTDWPQDRWLLLGMVQQQQAIA